MVVEASAEGNFSREIRTRKLSDLPKGDVLIKMDYSSDTQNLSMTIYPFILRGIALIGIDSATTGMVTRLKVRERPAQDWRFSGPASVAAIAGLGNHDAQIEKIPGSKQMGRALI